MVRFVLFLIAAPAAFAGEYAVLRSGQTLQVDRHEVEGATVRLLSGAGAIELPASAIAYFEAIPEPVKAPAPAVTEVPALPAAPEPKRVVDPKALIDLAAERHGVPRELLHSVARVESAYRADAVSPKGAIGIMQLMPGTAALLQADPHDPEQNVDAGARHLRDLLIQYNGATRKALAAYNAGAGAVDRYQGVPPYAETQNYVEKVLQGYWRLMATRQPAR